MRPYSWGLVQCLLLCGAIAIPSLGSVSHNLPSRHGDKHVPANGTDLPQAPDMSYFQYDSDPTIRLENASRHGGLTLFHGLVMVVNYMFLLPTVIVLRNARHRLYWIFQAISWALILLGWSTARAYRRATPDLYPGSVHGKTGAVLIALSALVTAVDVVPVLSQRLPALKYYLPSPIKWALSFVNTKRVRLPPHYEESQYLPITQPTERVDSTSSSAPILVDRHRESRDEIDMLGSVNKYDQQHHEPSLVMSTLSQAKEESRAFKHHRHIMRRSLGSDHSTLHDEPPTPSIARITFYQRMVRAGKACLMILERSLIPYAWGQALSGFSIYFGLGRTHYVTGVLAHFIKGSIFWWYGILTFSRYLGAWQRWGWAWNTLPQYMESPPWSAPFIESLVIFVYGFTQQFMERLGAHEGDPYSAKDVEHISIAVMFWAGGLVGMAIESPTIRRWLLRGNVIHQSQSRKRRPLGSPDPEIFSQNTSTSSNPLPALIIGVTGIAMSAHHQTYQFQVQIHALWGYLLLGFAICRCLTCFFEWIRPERRMSKLAGMPPTELIGSIFLGAGGFVFLCSDEEITLWAMRTNRDDVMMFLNLSLAFTCFGYCWVTFILLMVGRMRWNRPRL